MAPTQSQVLAHSGGDDAGRDIGWYTGLDELKSGSGDQILSLPNGSTPTYQACAADTLATNAAGVNPGTAFCILENTGYMAGVTVTSLSIHNPYSIVLNVTIWKNSP